MKKLFLALMLTCSIPSFASVEESCPREYTEISTFQKEVIQMFLNEEIEKEDVRTLGLATSGLLASGASCAQLQKDLDNIKRTAGKL